MAVSTQRRPGGQPGIQSTVGRSLDRTAFRHLAVGTILGLTLALFIIGTAWDIQWHVAVGRDRALTLPHVVMLAGIILSGVVSLLLVLVDSWSFRRQTGITSQNSSRILGLFHVPIGFAAAGTGALLSALSFPLDDYWHTLYGIDVTLWAPFHVMIITGMLLVGLGTLYAIASELNRRGSGQTRLPTQILLAALWSVTFGVLLLELPQANAVDGLTRIGSYAFVLYPVLLGFAVALFLAGVVHSTRLVGSATLAVLVFLALRLILFSLVPWATNTVVAAEGLSFRPNGPESVIVPTAYPMWIILAALGVDLVYWATRRWGALRYRMLVLAAGAGALVTTLLDQSWARILPKYFFPQMDTQQMYVQALPFTLLAIGLGLATAHLITRSLTTIKH